ncbi:Uncharacterized protein OS=Singulisphaera acidiphila (strain ATCC BAA-1392 / DSM 18658 / VKM B-2454 / MOB10) GN=Sinac_6530 PE=4 SV=1 [Gemmata massiliana]|uniref:Uncharacterized protein n=1 Tax=Gemmata massiliana TaxID=1210884 RepID=A0A6P2DAF8_9BACT|nr:hypothetical protein [Gemmata massiliana]VTR96500.1 Uncharacterized protein OS=Singulisphaera acidiphila (strain ATCC BAA-1392 / DSM 18658 / VKM B-2454 / MOB10) GN=Sinac_6530 PE=4 SV=1 [Gemmata massiliana]
MAAVLEQAEAATKNGTRVDEQIAQATSRIRTHDITFGGLVLVAFVLVYATAMILLDKYLGLAEWLRQVAFLGFLAACAGIAYATILSPLRKKINPLYAAKRVESTIDDAKNSVTGYVDAQQQGTLNATVKAALAHRAAKSVAAADVNKAVDHRGLLYLGGTSVALFLTLIVLFFVFRPAQFSSLVGRAFVPFGSGDIVTRTHIDVVRPDPAEATVTTGQTIVVAVHVGGKIPSADGPERVRLMIRHNQADPNYTELPMVQGDTSRDFELRVPDHLVQYGFWYKVAGGDYTTPEYRVTVRTLPLFTEFQATYEYPAYLRRKTEPTNDPQLRAPRGTTVTLVGRTNRDVREGTMVVEPGGVRVTGTPVADKPDSLAFKLKLTESGSYKLSFNATTGEHSTDSFQSRILVEADKAPEIAINKPEEDEITAPTNGQIAIDGKVGDDFGIDTITLKMKIVSPVERPLLDRPYLNGKDKSFHRKKDNTWPTDVDYKGSVDLAQLKADPTGLPLTLTPDMVIEFWLEATDNCTEPKPNLGRSVAKRVRLTPPKVEPQDKQKLDQDKANRKDEEQKHDAQQEQKLDQENRDPKNGNNGGQNQNQPDQKTEPKNGTNGEGTKEGPPDPTKMPPPNKDKSEPKTDNPMGGMSETGNPMGSPTPKGGMNDPSSKPMGSTEPNGTNTQNGTNPDRPMPEAPPPKSPEEKSVQDRADKLNNAIEKEKQEGGSGKSNPSANENERTDSAQQKKQPPAGDMGNATEPKPEPKQGEPNNPMQDNAPASGKSEGKLEKPSNPAEPKPEPKQGEPKPGNDPMNKAGQKNTAPSETRDEPVGAPPGVDKEPKQSQPNPKDPNPKDPKDPNPNPDQKQDPNSGSKAKSATQKGDEQQGGMSDSTDKKDPAADAGSGPKPMREPTRGEDKPNQPQNQPQPAGGTKPENKQPDAGDAKPNKAPAPSENKPKPEDMMSGGTGTPESKPEGDANQSTKPNSTGAAETKSAGNKNAPMNGGNSGADEGRDKPPPQEGAQPSGGRDQEPPKQKELDDNQRKELEEAARNLTSPDEKKKQDARNKLDKAIGEDKRKEMEKLANDLQSPDENKRAEAQRKLDELKKQAQQQQGKPNGENGGKPDEKQMKELEQAAKDLNSPDKNKQQEARDKLDKAIGEDKRKELEQLAKDLQSGDKSKQQAAQKKIEDAVKNAKGGGGDQGDQKNAPKLDEKQMKELEQAAKDLTSPDEKKKQDAREKLDKAIGEDKRKEMEKLANDLQSPDEKTRAEAQRKLDELKKQAQQQQGKPNGENGGKPDEKQMKEIADAMKDLQSGDEQKKQAAQQKLDKMVGEKNRKEAEQLMKDLQSGNKETREAAEKKLDDLKKQLEKQQAGKNGKDGKGKEPSKEELADLMKKAQDLQSKDKDTREKAEKDLDNKLGKENREKLQKELEDKKPGGDPQQDEKLKEQLEQMAKEPSNQSHEPTQNGPGSSPPPKGAMEEDPQNRLKTAELRLEDFERKRYDEEFQKKQGFSEAEYKKFLDDYTKHVENLRKEANQPAGNKPPQPGSSEPGGPILGGGGNKVAPSAKLDSSGTGGGSTVAPPGFENSKNKFQKLIQEKK